MAKSDIVRGLGQKAIHTMADPHRIVEVKSEWVIDREDMGTKTKFWYRDPDGGVEWLFKYPRPNTGEHWSEKVAAEVASVIGVRHAKVELAELAGERGSATKSFARGGWALYHGNQMLKWIVRGYEPKRRFRQSQHTLADIFEGMDRVFVRPEAASRAKRTLAEYAVLDALIGNTDRHHENWGLLRRREGGVLKGFVAPSFDHATSLGRELLDERRDRFLAENRVGGYAEKGRGAIYWSEDERRGPSPLELVRRAVRTYPDLFRPAVLKLTGIDKNVFSQIVDRIPSDWMTSSARVFAVTLLFYNYNQLKEIFR